MDMCEVLKGRSIPYQRNDLSIVQGVAEIAILDAVPQICIFTVAQGSHVSNT